MVKFSVPISSILGLSYYRYELTVDDANPTIDDTIQITCTCRNVFGNTVESKTLTLYLDGTSKGTATTNTNGEATWNVKMTNWGLKTFEVGNTNLSVKVGGFKQVQSYASGFYTLSIDDSTRTARLRVNISNTNITSGENYKQTGWINSDYRPNGTMYTLLNRLQTIVFYANSGGDVTVYNTTANTISGFSGTTMIYWNY